MAWTFNGTGSQVRIPDGAHLDIPGGDWTFAGWFRQSDNSDSNFKRILCWGTPGGTPHVQVFLPGTGVGDTNNDHLSARVIGTGGADTGILFSTGYALSDNLDQWHPWCLTHDDSSNTTYLKILDRSSSTFYTDSSVVSLGSMNIAEDLYLGATNAGTDSTRWVGDMADVAFFPGLYFDNNQWHGYIHGGRAFRFPECSWHAPMLSEREEIWATGNSIITPNTTNISTNTVFDNPQIQTITPKIEDAMEETDPVTIRVTRQVSEVLYTETPEVRLTQQYIMVLEGPLVGDEETVNQAMSITDDASYTKIGTHNETVNDAMVLTQNIALTGILSTPASSDLGLSDATSAVRDIPVGAASSISFTSVGGRKLQFDTDSTMALYQLAGDFLLIDDRKPCGNVMTLVQEVEEASSKFMSHDLGLTQTLDIVFPIKPNIVQNLGISQHTSTPYHFWVHDITGISQFLPTPLTPQHVSHTLNLVQDAPIGLFEQTLNLVQTVNFAKSLTAANTINMSHILDRTMIYVREVEDADVVGHALTWYEDTPCGRKRYTPFQGENTIPLDVTPPSDVLQDPQGDTGNFSLYQPYLGTPLTQVTLRKPELDNRDRNAYTRVNRESRGGKMLVYADPNWPKIRTLAVTIIGLIESEVDELHSFMQETLGQEIGLTDWEGRLWKGFITNPNEAATQDGRKMWTVTFEFEGEMLEVEQPGNDDGNGMAMNLSQSVTAVIV